MMIHFKHIKQYEESKVLGIKKNLITRAALGKKKISKSYSVEKDFKYSLDWRLKRDLDILIDDLKQDDDALIIIVAAEGSGKTVFESQIGHYISTKTKIPLTVDDVHFEGQGYMDKALASPRLSVNCLDESRRALNKMRASSGSNVDFNNFLSECRSNNQVHIIVLPAYTDLEQYVAIHRVKMLLSVEKFRDPKTKRLIRGNFSVWNTKSKTMLKKAWDGKYKEFPRNMLKYKGKFDKTLCFNEKEYDKKKEDAKKERYMSKEEPAKPDAMKELVLQHHNDGKSSREIGKMINKSKSTVNEWLKELNNNKADGQS